MKFKTLIEPKDHNKYLVFGENGNSESILVSLPLEHYCTENYKLRLDRVPHRNRIYDISSYRLIRG